METRANGLYWVDKGSGDWSIGEWYKGEWIDVLGWHEGMFPAADSDFDGIDERRIVREAS